MAITRITASIEWDPDISGPGPENEEEAIQGLLESLADDCATITIERDDD